MSRARVLLAAAVALALAALAVVPDVSARVVSAVAAPAAPAAAAVAGGVVCPVGDATDGAVLDLTLAAPAARTEDAAAPAPARATVVVLGERPARAAPAPLAPGALAVVGTDVAPDGSTWVGWADAPVVAWREWRRPGAPGSPRGRAAGACVRADAVTWHVVGLRTDGGAEARLRFANPFAVDATMAVTLVTTDGGVAPIALQNLSVPAGGTVDLRVNDHVPERADVAAIVRVTSGRAAVEGLQLALAGVGGVDGVTLVPAATTAATAWTVPWVPSPADGDAWVSVLNPGERDVELEVTVHDVDGPGLPPGAEGVVVPAGRLVRIAAAELLPPGAAAAGVTLRSPTDPVVVGGALWLDPGDPAASGIAALPALPAGDTAWLLAGVAGEDRRETVQLVNVDADEVTAVLTLGGPDGAARALPAVTIPPGGRGEVALPLVADAGWSVEVVADGEVVVARSGTATGAPDPIVAAGVPSAAWRTAAPGLVGTRRDGWTLWTPLP
jgi:hypothetical protein